METRSILGALFALALPAAAWAAPVKIPKVDGGQIGVDPYVQEFQTAMEQANAELAGIKSAILAVQVPLGTKAGALAAGAKAAADYAAVASVVLKAENAHAKFLTHIMGYKPTDNIDVKLSLSGPAFEEKRDADLRPQADHIMKGAGGASRFASAAGAAQPKFTPASSQFSYGAVSGPAGSGFPELSPTAPQAGAIATLGHTGTGGGGVSTGASDNLAGIAAAAHDAAPAVGPAATSLSMNKSDVAENALKRAQERQNAAEAEAQRSKQEKDQRNQQMAQMAMQMLSQAGQALGQTQKSSGECKNCNKGKQTEAQNTAAASPT